MSQRPMIASGGSTPSRVLFLHPSDELYGADRVLLNLLTGIDRSRFEPLVVLADDLPYDGLLSAELRARAIEVRHLPIAVARRKYLTPTGIGSFIIRMHRSVRMLSRVIEAERIDLVYTNTLAVWVGAIVAARTHRPHLWHVHEIITRPAALHRFMRWLVPAFSQRVVCVSQAALDHLLVSTLARSKGVVLRNGLNAEEWVEATGRARVRAELSCGEDDVLVGMVGRVSALKAPDRFVIAASSLLAKNLPVRFVIVGDVVPGQQAILDELRCQIATAPCPERFHLLGFRRDIPDITAALDLLVVPSREPESFSLVSVQAMLGSKPVVATDVGAMKETIVHGETGLVVPREETAALVEAIAALVRDPDRRATMGRAGEQSARARFGLERQVREFNDLLSHELSAEPARSVRKPATRPVVTQVFSQYQSAEEEQ